MGKYSWKKILEENKVEETPVYVVEKVEDYFKIYHKKESTIILCSKYIIAGNAVIYKDINGPFYYHNETDPQKVDKRTNEELTRFEIQSWGKDKKGALVITYIENGVEKARGVDSEGKIFTIKKNRKKKASKQDEIKQEEGLSL